MQFANFCRTSSRFAGFSAALLSTVVNLIAPASLAAETRKHSPATPIQHVIVIIGENRTFDHLFATYVPPKGQTINNLLSEGIVNADGTPGSNFNLAAQWKALDQKTYELSPRINYSLYGSLPPTNTQGAPPVASDSSPAPFQTVTAAQQAEPGLLPEDYTILTTGATGLPRGVVDTRLRNVFHLANGPYQLTPDIPYDAYAGSPVHRYYQMWQQLDCSAKNASKQNPSGCLNDLFPWVETTISAGSNGLPRPAGFNNETTHEGSISMGFYNVQQGDMPYFNSLAKTYAISDNYHQAGWGGTGLNHILLGSGDGFYYSDGNGNPIVPPSNEIENPNPVAGTNNWYTEDGYGTFVNGQPAGGGSYTNCADPKQPGVQPILQYFNSLAAHPRANCAPGAYYLLNNYSPGYYGDGTVNSNPFAIPPSSVPTIADSLTAASVGWRYYGDHWNLYVQDPTFSNPWNQYCDICNFAQYSTSIMTNPTLREEHIKDVTDLYNDIQDGTLPAVSFVKPSGFVDGHPASSKFDLFEAFTKKIVTEVQANKELWASTAILITVDEGGGYYDSGFVQQLDWFGDGTRIPLIVVSPFAKGGKVDHTYYDHVSILKFIEKNWGLAPVSGRSRDNLPNPIQTKDNPYVPVNSPAIGDLINLFSF
jgi:phospholipase C